VTGLRGSGVSRSRGAARREPPRPRNLATAFLADAREWARGRMWVPRALLLAILALLQLLHIRFFSGITFAFHEMGHLAFAWGPKFLAVAGGSIFQLAIPTIAAIYLYKKQEDYFGAAIGAIWLAYAMWELSDYVGDARSQDLPLVGFAAPEDLEHDWHYLLGTLRLLPLDHFFAFVMKVVSLGIGAAAVAFAIWLLMQMRRQPYEHKTTVR
jgi:hypothetical protein